MRKPCPVIVLTGGPAAGKTTVIERIAAMTAVRVVPEVFSLAPEMLRSMSVTERQTHIFRTHLQLLGAACTAAAEDGTRLILCDRGTLDGVGYIGEEGFLALSGIRALSDEYPRYDAVIYLESVALLSEGIYNALTNERRAESYGSALTLSARQRAAWEGHPRFRSVAADPDFDRKADTAVKLIWEVLHG